MGFEPITYRLRSDCSTVELRRRLRIAPRERPSRRSFHGSRLAPSARLGTVAVGVVKRAAVRALVELEVVEEIIDDLPIVESNLRQRTPADLDNLVNVAGTASVFVVDRRVAGVVRLRTRRRFDAAQRRLMSVHSARFDAPRCEASPMIIEYRGKRPKIDPSAFVAPTAVLIGDVEIGAESSIWFGAVLRGDNGPIRVGARTSIQDNAVLHVSEGGGTFVGDDVTVGHAAVMEDCTIERHALIGSNATLLNGCTVGEGSLIGAGSVVAQRAEI